MTDQDKIITATPEYPFHVSIGALVVNDNSEICVHHFDTLEIGEYKADDFYILMRESPDGDENYLQTLERGLLEEFGMRAKPVHYIGSLQESLVFKNTQEKTTLYFLCKFVTQDETLRSRDDPESHTSIEWHDTDFLIKKMIEQGKKYPKYSIDEHEIVERTKQFL